MPTHGVGMAPGTRLQPRPFCAWPVVAYFDRIGRAFRYNRYDRSVSPLGSGQILTTSERQRIVSRAVSRCGFHSRWRCAIGDPSTNGQFTRSVRMGMPEALTAGPDTFVDRRGYGSYDGPPGRERRQFADSHDELTADAKELARAIDAYKLMHRRRFITHDEMLAVFKSLGYHR
jgi:hypothetical protein